MTNHCKNALLIAARENPEGYLEVRSSLILAALGEIEPNPSKTKIAEKRCRDCAYLIVPTGAEPCASCDDAPSWAPAP